MKIFLNFFLCSLFAISSMVFALETKETANDFLVFQVIQDQMTLNNDNIDNASIIYRPDGSYQGLLVVLKSAYANDMQRLTTAGMGKPANLIFNKEIISTIVIQTEIANNVLITGLSKEKAEAFLLAMKKREQLKVDARKAQTQAENKQDSNSPYQNGARQVIY